MSGKILQHFNEMATNTGVNRDTFNRTHEFDTMKKTEFMKLLKDNLGANRYKFYQNGTESFYLADDNNNYLGHMELDNGAITSTFSLLNGGFYNIMFSSIFALTNIRKIYSDESLSTQAIGSYIKLSQLPNKSFKPYYDNTKWRGGV